MIFSGIRFVCKVDWDRVKERGLWFKYVIDRNKYVN